MKLTKEEYELSVNKIIDICNWCKNNNMSCKQCTDSYGACRRNVELLKYSDLIKEHFDNPPLKVEEIKIGMRVWDNKRKKYFHVSPTFDKPTAPLDWYYTQSGWVDVSGNSYTEQDAHAVRFEENRFYRREV